MLRTKRLSKVFSLPFVSSRSRRLGRLSSLENRRRRRSLAVETLEDRTLLSANFFLTPGNDVNGDLAFQADLTQPFTEVDLE